MARISVILSLAFLATLALSAPQTKPLRFPTLPKSNTTTTAAIKLPLTPAPSTVTPAGDDDDEVHGNGTTTTTVLPLVSNGTTIGNVSIEATTLPTPANETTTTADATGTSTSASTTSATPNASSRPVVATTEGGFWSRLNWGHITLIVLGAAAALLMISCLLSCLVFDEGAFYLVGCGPCRRH